MVRTARKRADGAASSEAILDAATRVAGQRGFIGMTIAAVSELSGLPASSIYWHFETKDDLVAAVIDRSWTEVQSAIEQGALTMPDDVSGEALFRVGTERVTRALAAFPLFLRLGLFLVLDHDPDGPTARTKFLGVRQETKERCRFFYGAVFDDLTAEQVGALATLTVAISDGVFIAREAGEIDLDEACDLMLTALVAATDRFRSSNDVGSQRASRKAGS